MREQFLSRALRELTNRIGGNIQVESEAVGRMIIRDVDT
jgi:hypothetical protein